MANKMGLSHYTFGFFPTLHGDSVRNLEGAPRSALFDNRPESLLRGQEQLKLHLFRTFTKT